MNSDGLLHMVPALSKYTDSGGTTALHSACLLGHTQVMHSIEYSVLDEGEEEWRGEERRGEEKYSGFKEDIEGLGGRTRSILRREIH